eukprot:g41758.t1
MFLGTNSVIAFSFYYCVLLICHRQASPPSDGLPNRRVRVPVRGRHTLPPLCKVHVARRLRRPSSVVVLCGLQLLVSPALRPTPRHVMVRLHLGTIDIRALIPP